VADCMTLASGSEGPRPAVRLLVLRAKDIDLQPVFWGLEEEGIPFELQEAAQGNAVALAKEAAHMSPLNVGIAVSGAEQAIVLHHRDLPADQPLFVINLRSAALRDLRRLGINAARLVKAEPLVLKDEPVSDLPNPVPRKQAAGASDDLVERIVQSVLAEMAKARGTLWNKTASA
jgi:hypothetical protein